MLMFAVTLVDKDGVRINSTPVFMVITHGLPRDNQEATEELFDQIYEKVRKNDEFKELEVAEDGATRGLPPGYRMNAEIVEFDPNFVSFIYL